MYPPLCFTFRLFSEVLRLWLLAYREELLVLIVVDINCDVTSVYIRTVAIIMKQVTEATAARIHFAFRGRLMSLLVLRTAGSHRGLCSRSNKEGRLKAGFAPNAGIPL